MSDDNDSGDNESNGSDSPGLIILKNTTIKKH